jgi:hypothetical protein
MLQLIIGHNLTKCNVSNTFHEKNHRFENNAIFSSLERPLLCVLCVCLVCALSRKETSSLNGIQEPERKTRALKYEREKSESWERESKSVKCTGPKQSAKAPA